MTPEGKIVAHAKKECRRLGLRFLRLSFGPGNETGWMDALILGPIGCDGQVLWMETKRLGKDLKPIQAHRRDEVRERGGYHCKPDTKEHVTRHLEDFKLVCDRKHFVPEHVCVAEVVGVGPIYACAICEKDMDD